jgi:hypothetical protein
MNTASAQTAPHFELEAKPAPAVVAPAPTLITEKQVLFSTAAAVAVRPTTIRRWPNAMAAVRSVVGGMWTTSTADSREPHPHYPKRYEFLEQACMSREMSRP